MVDALKAKEPNEIKKQDELVKPVPTGWEEEPSDDEME